MLERVVLLEGIYIHIIYIIYNISYSYSYSYLFSIAKGIQFFTVFYCELFDITTHKKSYVIMPLCKTTIISKLEHFTQEYIKC